MPDPTARRRGHHVPRPVRLAGRRRWLMAVGAGYADEVAAIRLYSSPDLHTWTRLDDLSLHSAPVGGRIDTGSAWECPQILHLGEQLDRRRRHLESGVRPDPVAGLPGRRSRPAGPGRPRNVALRRLRAARQSARTAAVRLGDRGPRARSVWTEAGLGRRVALPRQVWWEHGVSPCRRRSRPWRTCGPANRDRPTGPPSALNARSCCRPRPPAYDSDSTTPSSSRSSRTPRSDTLTVETTRRHGRMTSHARSVQPARRSDDVRTAQPSGFSSTDRSRGVHQRRPRADDPGVPDRLHRRGVSRPPRTRRSGSRRRAKISRSAESGSGAIG